MKTFNDWYKLATEYYKEHGDLNVPFDYITEDKSRLGIWILKIRGRYAGKSSYGSSLSPEQIRMLETIGMIWNGTKPENYSIENCKTKQDFIRHRELYLSGSFDETPLYDAVLDLYPSSSIYAIAKKYGVKPQIVRKILITAGLYTSPKQLLILDYYNQGMELTEIAEKMSMSKPSVDYYLPLYVSWGKAQAHKENAVVDNRPNKAKELTEELIYEVDRDYRTGSSIPQLIKNYGFSKRKIIKILVSSGAYSTDRSREIARLIERGKTPEEIADILNITIPAVNTYMPYERSAYNTGEHSKNSVYSKNYRNRKRYNENKRWGVHEL